jgi:hypothetical protein
MKFISSKKQREAIGKAVQELPTQDKLDISLFSQEHTDLTKWAGFRAGRSETLPVGSIWERTSPSYVSDRKVYSTTKNAMEGKYEQLEKTDRIIVHISPEDFSLERRVEHSGESLPYGKNHTNVIDEETQYQILVTSEGNIMVRTITQYDSDTLPRIEEIAYLTSSGIERSFSGTNPHSLDRELKEWYLAQIADQLPEHDGINKVNEHGKYRESRVITPDRQLGLVYDALETAGYHKVEKAQAEKA